MMFIEGFEHRLASNKLLQPTQNSSRSHPAEGNEGDVSPLFKRETSAAKLLCIYDGYHKLAKYGEYDIGGTYRDGEPDLWFYFTTSFCPGGKYLLNVFVCIRKEGTYDIGISDSHHLTHIQTPAMNTGRCCLPYSFKWQILKSTQPDEKFFLKTYCIPRDLLENHTLCIPVSIKWNPPSSFNMEFVKRVKINHDFGDLLSKQDKSNFVVQSASGKQYPVHKIILAAHSPVLRNLVKSDGVSNLFLDISDNDMELLLQFLYTGTIKDILKQDCVNLLDIAAKFELGNLFSLVQYAIAGQINVTNCMELAVMSEKYKLEQLQTIVFQFIKEHPKVFETEGWDKLDDVNLAKKLIQYTHCNVRNS